MLRHSESGTHRVCVAVTAAGSGIAQTVIDGLRACPFPVRIVGFERSGRAKGLYECDAAHRLPSASDAAYQEQLLSLCHREGVELLIPGSDHELPKIAEAATELEQDGCRVLSSSPECISICQDKKALHDFLAERDAPFFPTWLASDVAADPDTIPYPAILKPRWGSGSDGIHILSASSDWNTVRARQSEGSFETCVVQPLGRSSSWDDETWRRILDDRELRRQDQHHLAVQLFFAEDGQVIGRVAWLARMKHGVVMSIEIINEPEIWKAVEATEHVLSPLGVRGPLNIQGIWTGERATFFEVNVRFSGSTEVRALLGYREVEAAVRHFVLKESNDQVRTLLGPVRRWIGLRQMTERVVPSSWVQSFEKRGQLSFPVPLERIVITGGSGYLGQKVVQTLLRSLPSTEIVLPVRDPDQFDLQWKDNPCRDRLHVLAWEEFEGLSSAVMGEALVHLAAVRPPVADSSSSMFVENLRLTQLAVRAVHRLSIPLFVFVSSHAVYEGVQPPWTEDTAIWPQSPYAYAKAACEEMVRQLSGYGIRYAIFRLAGLYGLAGRMQWERVAHRFAERAAKGLSLEVHGDGHQTIDLVHVGDGARAVCSVLQGPDTAWNRAYNITTGTPIEIMKLAELCRDIAAETKGLAVPIELKQLAVPTTPRSYGSSNQLARDLLGWSPQISLRAGLEEIMRHILKEQRSSER